MVDERTLVDGWHPDSHVDTGPSGIELPLETIRRMVHAANTVIVRRDGRGVVTDVEGALLDLGRSTRLASRAQRRALRVMHPTCAVGGCAVPFDHCQPHHILWWRHLGTSDLANLVPLCGRHHHAVHDRGWTLELAADRTLTTTRSDGTRLIGTIARRWPA